MNANLKYGTVIGVVVSLIAIAGAVVTLDDRYAHADEIKKLSRRLDQKILEDRSDRLRDRVWKLEDRPKLAPLDRDELRKLKAEKDRLDIEIKAIIDKTLEAR